MLGAPEWAPFVSKIKLAGYTAFGLLLLLWAIIAILIIKPRAAAFHGDARFARRSDLAKANMLKKTTESVMLGRFGRDHFYLNGTQHIIVTSPTRSGKTASLVIPALLTYKGSVVCTDVKGELLELTSGERAAWGQTIYKFAPYADDGYTHRFNPFLCLSSRPDVRVSEIQSIGAILYPDDPNQNPFFTSQSRAAFLGFASYMYERWDGLTKGGCRLDPNSNSLFPSFERIYRLTTGDGKGGSTQDMIKHWLTQSKFMSEQTRTLLSGLAGIVGETFTNVIASMQEPLSQFISPILANSTNASDFDADILRRRPTTIYVVIPPGKLGESSKLLNIFFSTVINQNLKVAPADDKTIQNQLLLVLDELASMGRVNALVDRISIMAGYWVRVMSIIQSNSQLRSIYGADTARTFTTNHGVSIIFTPQEQEDAEDYAKAMGNTTVRRRNRTTAQGGTSYTYTEESRPLMLAQELKALPMDDEIVFYTGCAPIKAKKNWWFKSSFFKKRVKPAVKIPPLALKGKPVPSQTTREEGVAVG